ncbi:bacterio-opsin activator domain-containing protein [Halobaculum litoreum]|uniref:Bacterio-opsin activator domain-containing protein n=1 Tax=Halobaculum litoreum TaxID=3031998 RepID=A0ABD5XW80_9EURY
MLLGDHGLLVAVESSRSAESEDVDELLELIAATAEAALDRVAREDALRDTEEVLTEQSARLAELHELNTQLRSVEHVLVMAEDRAAIERGVCDRLVESDRFALAWFAEADGDTVVPTYRAGVERGYLPTIERLGDANEPTAVAARTGEPVVVDRLSERLHEEPWRREALASGYRGAMSVPLTHDGRFHGVLSVLARRADAFDPLVRSVLADLSDTVAYAIGAVEARRAVLADRVVEVTVRTGTRRDPLARIAAETGARVRFDGSVAGESTRRVFFTVWGADAARVREVASADSAITAVRTLRTTGDGGAFEVDTAVPTVASEVVDHGGVPLTVESEGDATTAVVELPHGADVGGFVAALRNRFRDVAMTARRGVEREPRTRESFRHEFASAVTDRQPRCWRRRTGPATSSRPDR